MGCTSMMHLANLSKQMRLHLFLRPICFCDTVYNVSMIALFFMDREGGGDQKMIEKRWMTTAPLHPHIPTYYPFF